VIWSDLGQRIFQYRLTSISNDIRNFTINLFHHHTIRGLFEQNKLELSERQKRHFRSDSSLKMGLVLFLENLLVYSLFDLNETNGGGVSLEGVLGSLNARTRWAAQNHDPPIGTSPKHELLVRQVSLGINGRYKTPFMQMGIINRDYSYPLGSETWTEIDRLFSDAGQWSQDSKHLQAAVGDIVRKAFRVSSSGGDIELSYRKCLETASNRGVDLRELYKRVFGQTSLIPPKVKRFLMNQMGLNIGAAGALYAALTKHIAYVNNKQYESIFSAALREEMTEHEKRLLEDIIQVEPHLSRLSYVFDRICSPETYSVDDVEGVARPVLEISAENAGSIEDIRSRIAAGSTTAAHRLRQIADVLLSGDVPTFVSGLYDYHKQVMDFRSLPVWFSLHGGRITHGTKTSVSADDSFDFRHPRWIHDFYLNTLNSLARGIGKA